jgi:hypothetical protein
MNRLISSFLPPSLPPHLAGPAVTPCSLSKQVWTAPPSFPTSLPPSLLTLQARQRVFALYQHWCGQSFFS